MNFKVEKKGQDVEFLNSDTNEKFNYVTFADNLYNGKKIKITNYSNLSGDEKSIVKQAIQELNDLSNVRKRKKIISQYNEE